MTGRDAEQPRLDTEPARVPTKRPPASNEALEQAGYKGGMLVESIEPGGPVDGRVQVGDLVSKLSNTR